MSLAGWENAEVLQLKLDSSLIDADLTDFVVDVQLGAAVGKTGFDATAPFDDLTPLVVDDDFTGIDGDAPDVRLWNDVQYSSLDTTGNVVPDIRNNSLDFALSVVESYPYISSKYMLSGDFDIQVDYVIDAIPSIDTAWSLSLVTQTDHTDVFHTGSNFASSARYSIVAGPYRANTEGGTASTGGSSDTSGKLRIARSGSTCNLYYWGGSSWTLLHTDTSYTTADVYVLLFSRIWTDNKSLNVNFDNFVINSGTIVWPNTPKKMAFEVGDTGVQCFGEIVSWDYTNKLAHLCIKVPTATAATDPILNFYRDPAHADNTIYVGDTGVSSIDCMSAVNLVTDFTPPSARTYRIKVPSSEVTASGGSGVIVKFGRVSNDISITSCYVGHVGTGLDFDGGQVQVKSAGSESFTVNADGFESDPVPFIVDGSDLIIEITADKYPYTASGPAGATIGYILSFTGQGGDSFTGYTDGGSNWVSIEGVVSSPPAQAVWSSSHKVALAMAQDPSAGNLLDSTINGNDGTPSNLAAGQLVDMASPFFGKGIDFVGDATEQVVVSAAATIDTAQKTLVLQVDLDGHAGSDANGSHFVSKNSWFFATDPPNNRYIFGQNWSTTSGRWSIPMPSLDPHVIILTYDRGATANVPVISIDGVQQTVTEYSTPAGSVVSDTTDDLVIANYVSAARDIDGRVGCFRYLSEIASADWIAATSAALRDNLITWSLPGGTVSVLAALGQPYNLSLDPVLAALAQEYHLTVAVKNALAQVWAHILEVALNQYYGDADKIMSALSQHYHDAPQVMRALVQKYDDMVQTTTALGQQYNLMFKAETSLEQNWAVCGFQATAGLVQIWDLRLRNEVMAALGQYWGLFRDRQDVQVPLFWVMADGVLLNPTEFTWTISGNASANQCTIPLADHGVWRSIQLHGHMEIHWNGITYQFFVEEKTRTRSVSNKEFTANYILKGLSITAALEAPYALPINREWPQNTMASVIVAELAAVEGVEVDWRIDDFPVWGGTFHVSKQTPLSAIKALIGSATVEAVVQSSPEGKLIVRREITVTPAKWKETTADHIIYDDGGVFSDSDDRDVMPGYNYIEISNQIESDSRKWLEPEKISATSKRVRGYAVPWVDYFPLDTSGGSWVTITDNGPKTEEIAGELVEFIDGAGSLSKPFYKQDLQGKLYPLAITWLLADLGDVSADEDGSLTSTVPGNSLAKVSYLTKYREWTVQDQEIESVQVFIPGEEVTA